MRENMPYDPATRSHDLVPGRLYEAREAAIRRSQTQAIRTRKRSLGKWRVASEGFCDCQQCERKGKRVKLCLFDDKRLFLLNSWRKGGGQ